VPVSLPLSPPLDDDEPLSVLPPSLTVPPSAGGAPPSPGMQALPPMAARPIARIALVGVPQAMPTPHSASVEQIWTGPPSKAMAGQGDAAQTVPGVVPAS